MVTKFALIFLLFFNSLIVNATECKDFVGIFDIKINISMNDENGKEIKEVKNAHIDIVNDNLVVLKPKNVFSTNDEQVIATCDDLVKNIKLNSDNSRYKMKYGDFVKVADLPGKEKEKVTKNDATKIKKTGEDDKSKVDYEKKIEECKQREIRKVQSLRSGKKLSRTQEERFNDHIANLNNKCEKELSHFTRRHPYIEEKLSRERAFIDAEENRFNKALNKLPLNTKKLIKSDKYQTTDRDEITNRQSDEWKYHKKTPKEFVPKIPSGGGGIRGALDIDAERIEGYGAEFEDIEIE